MPTYEYRCLTCDEHFEIVQSFKDDALTSHVCGRCGSEQPVRKVFRPIGITFKGGGFYKTDNRRSSGSDSSGSGSSGTGSSESSGSSGSGSSSSDSAPAGSASAAKSA